MEKYTSAIITVSDRSYENKRIDLSGPEIEKWLIDKNYSVLKKIIVPDDVEIIKSTLIDMIKLKANLIITTGGTGISDRDLTPEATKDVIEKELPGFSEIMRLKSYEITRKSVLSRAVCGIREKSLIINLPGNPHAVTENLDIIETPLSHALDIINKRIVDCKEDENS